MKQKSLFTYELLLLAGGCCRFMQYLNHTPSVLCSGANVPCGDLAGAV